MTNCGNKPPENSSSICLTIMKDGTINNRRNTKMNNCVLLVKMFAGGFNVNNIGHKIIDYYLPDASDEYHIFVPPYGKVSNQKNIGPILLLEKTSVSYILRVVAVIKKHSIDDSNLDLVKYDGKPLTQILFSEEEKEDEVNEFKLSTFKCKETDYYKTRHLNLFIIPANKEDGPFSKDNRATLIEQFKEKYKGATLIELKDEKPWRNISYVKETSSDKETLSDYDQIIKQIVAKAKDNQKHDFASSSLNLLEYDQDNLLKYIDKEYDENAITSFLLSLLKDKPELAKEFIGFITNNYDKNPIIEKLCKQKLALTEGQIWINRYLSASKRGCESKDDHKKKLDKLEKQGKLSDSEKKMMNDPNAEPLERGIIDLFIETNNSVIVIENKIKSDLNGKNVDEDGEEVTQLSKYDKYLSAICSNKKCFLLVIAPDYNSEFRIESGLKTNPSVIKYSDLYDFFKKRLSEELAVGGVWENKYRLFLNTLKKHSISLEDEMLIRFKNAIKN